MTSFLISRRAFIAAFAGCAAYLPLVRTGMAAPLPLLQVMKDPACGCCSQWVAHMREAGFPVEVTETADITAAKTNHRVPADLASCHTARVAGYVIEGHVPAGAVKRLLQEKPAARGLAVPGMPVGSPGMEMPGAEPVAYEVILFDDTQRTLFERYRGAQRLTG
jgi:hypothetical protein